MSLFAKSFINHAVLTSVIKILDVQAIRVLNTWRDQTEPELKLAVDRAFNRISEASAAVRDAVQLIQEASK